MTTKIKSNEPLAAALTAYNDRAKLNLDAQADYWPHDIKNIVENCFLNGWHDLAERIQTAADIIL